MDPRELRSALARFTGSDDYHRHSSGLFSITDGVKFLADEVGAYWLLDLIASYQKRARKDRRLREVQIWELRVNLAEKSGVVTCSRDTDDEAFSQRLPVTDFPLHHIKFYLENGVLCLASERSNS